MPVYKERHQVTPRTSLLVITCTPLLGKEREGKIDIAMLYLGILEKGWAVEKRVWDGVCHGQQVMNSGELHSRQKSMLGR